MNHRVKKIRYHYDGVTVLFVLALMCIGVLMIASASLAISSRDFGTPFHYFFHQVVYTVLGLLLAFLTSRVSLDAWKYCAPYLLIISALGLIMVLLPGVGKSVNGATRWLGIGFINIQVSELIKLAVIMYIARYIDHNYITIKHSTWGFFKPIAILLSISILLLLEPDFGATVVIMLIALGVMFLSGAPINKFIGIFTSMFIAAIGLVLMAPYRMQRLLNFTNPWEHALGGGYQLTQALMAFGRGGVWGVGLGNSVQKMFYLPEAHTDFLFAVIGEETGLIGCVLVVLCYLSLILRSMWVAQQSYTKKKYFNCYVGYGIALWLALQSTINMGVNIGILPTKGLTLPFISYGGSSLLVSAIIFGVLLRIHHENSV